MPENMFDDQTELDRKAAEMGGGRRTREPVPAPVPEPSALDRAKGRPQAAGEDPFEKAKREGGPPAPSDPPPTPPPAINTERKPWSMPNLSFEAGKSDEKKRPERPPMPLNVAGAAAGPAVGGGEPPVNYEPGDTGTLPQPPVEQRGGSTAESNAGTERSTDLDIHPPMPTSPTVTPASKGGRGGGRGGSTRRGALGDQSRTAAYDPDLDKNDPRNIGVIDTSGKVNQQAYAASPMAHPEAYPAGTDQFTPGGQSPDLNIDQRDAQPATTGALKGAVNFVKSIFHQGMPDQHTNEGYTALTKGAVGAPDDDTMRSVFAVVDPNNQLDMKHRMELATRTGYDWYMHNGQPEKAEKFATDALQYGNKMAQNYGDQAIKELKAGNRDQAIKHLQTGYSWLPDGYHADPTADGKFMEIHDGKGKTVQKIPLDDKSIQNLGVGMATGTLYWDTVQHRAGVEQPFKPQAPQPTQAVSTQPPAPPGAAPPAAGPPAAGPPAAGPPAARPPVVTPPGTPPAAPPPPQAAAQPAAAPAGPTPPPAAAPPPTQAVTPAPPPTLQPAPAPPAPAGGSTLPPGLRERIVPPGATAPPSSPPPAPPSSPPPAPPPAEQKAGDAKPPDPNKPVTPTPPAAPSQKAADAPPIRQNPNDPDSIPVKWGDGTPMEPYRRSSVPVTEDIKRAQAAKQDADLQLEAQRRAIIDLRGKVDKKDYRSIQKLNEADKHIVEQHRIAVEEHNKVLEGYKQDQRTADAEERKQLEPKPLSDTRLQRAETEIENTFKGYTDSNTKDGKPTGTLTNSPLRMRADAKAREDMRDLAVGLMEHNPGLTGPDAAQAVITMTAHVWHDPDGQKLNMNKGKGEQGARYLVTNRDLLKQPVVKLADGRTILHVPQPLLNKVQNFKAESYRKQEEDWKKDPANPKAEKVPQADVNAILPEWAQSTPQQQKDEPIKSGVKALGGGVQDAVTGGSGTFGPIGDAIERYKKKREFYKAHPDQVPAWAKEIGRYLGDKAE